MLNDIIDYLRDNYPNQRFDKYVNNLNTDTIYFNSLFVENIYTEIWEKDNYIEVKTFVVNSDKNPTALMYSKMSSGRPDSVFKKVKSDSELLRKII